MAEPSRYALRAAEVSRQLAEEDGLKAACDALEQLGPDLAGQTLVHREDGKP